MDAVVTGTGGVGGVHRPARPPEARRVLRHDADGVAVAALPDDEVDVVAWWPLRPRRGELTYPHDRELVARRRHVSAAS